MSEKRIVEINGVKMEIDLRTAKIIETYKVGDSIKVLKKTYGNSYDVLPGAIVGFTEFASLPTIEILTVDRSGDVAFLAWNEKSEGIEIAPFNKYEMAFDHASIMARLDSNINDAREKLRMAEQKQSAFITSFAKVFDMDTVDK